MATYCNWLHNRCLHPEHVVPQRSNDQSTRQIADVACQENFIIALIHSTPTTRENFMLQRGILADLIVEIEDSAAINIAIAQEGIERLNDLLRQLAQVKERYELIGEQDASSDETRHIRRDLKTLRALIMRGRR